MGVEDTEMSDAEGSWQSLCQVIELKSSCDHEMHVLHTTLVWCLLPHDMM